MPKRGTKDTGTQQEVTRQVTGGAVGHFDSLENVRSVSPVSAVSCVDSDVKDVDIFRMRVSELEHELRLARQQIEQTKREKADLTGMTTLRAETAHKCFSPNEESIPKPRTYAHVNVDLPRVELTPFDGNPEQYCQFIRQYENFVECKTDDAGQRFLFLLHYCRGKAKEAIQGCAMLDPELGYPRARNILKEMFGQPFRVARNMIDGVLAEARRTRGDTRSLSNLVIKMQNCSIALNHLDYRSDLDALHTLESIVRCLPAELQTAWATEADRIEKRNREANFDELTEFIGCQSRIANSRFGQLARESIRTTRPSTSFTPSGSRGPHPPNNWANTNLISYETHKQTKCRLCSGDHKLVTCPEFLAMKVMDRWTLAKRIGSCFVCLGDTHRAALCRNRNNCGQDNCRARHHPLLHNEGRVESRINNDRVEITNEHSAEDTPKSVCTIGRVASGSVRLGILPIQVETPRGMVQAVAFLDNGSDTTLVRESFAREHDLGGQNTPLVISTVNGARAVQASQLSLKLASTSGEDTIEVNQAFTIADLPMRASKSIRSLARRWPHLHDLPLEDVPDTRVDILIGCDVPEAHWVLDQRIGGRRDPYAVRTIFGWILCGPLGNDSNYATSINYISRPDNPIGNDLERIYNHEFGDIADDRVSMSREDRSALSIVTEMTRHIGTQFEVPLPWRMGSNRLPDNREVAVHRLNYLKGRLKRDAQLREAYCNAMERNLQLGYIERAIREVDKEQPVWYLPHHPVINPKKPQKTRIVFDCAAKCDGIALNDHLLQGPDLTTPLIEVLCRFRLGSVAVAADIQEMFMQVKIPEGQRDALRLWWWPDGDLDGPAQEYRMTVHPFGAISSPFCANFALRTTVNKFAQRFKTPVGSCVENNFYVDDFLGSFDSAEEAVRHIRDLSKLLLMGGFKLTKWMSNSRHAIDCIPMDERSPSLRDLQGAQLPTDRALGVQWDSEKDEFLFQLQLPEKAATRRGILSSLASLYDPMGFVAPWLLPGKILLQDLCRKQVTWDETLSEVDHNTWQSWWLSLSKLGDIRLPRPIPGLRKDQQSELHVFADASEVGYGVVAYSCSSQTGGRRHSSILFAKARVAPLKAVSIPRLELAAAVLAVRVGKMLKRCFHSIEWTVTYWTDSAIVLHYINNVRTRFSTFIANRLAVIHEETEVCQWQHVNSCDNPADYCSRGVLNLEKFKTWLHGPAFLTNQPSEWPITQVSPVAAELLEVKRTVTLVTTSTNILLQKLHRFSRWTKVLRVVVWWTRFKRQLTIMRGLRPYDTLNIGPIVPTELKIAEADLIRMVQLQAFPSEIQRLSKENCDFDRRALRRSSLQKLCPILVDGLLRVGGRLTNSNLDFDAKHPIIFPNNHHITHTLIIHIHMQEGHAGENHLLNAIRRRFWIVKGRATVKRIVGNCLFCRRQNATLSKQLMASLPNSRVQPGWWPFAETGVDYFGPLWVKRKTSTEKRYGCLMTCLQSRAVHLESVHSMSTDSFLMAWQRFVGRRGNPSNVFSDNGSNFVGAHNEMKKWLTRIDKHTLQDRLSPSGTQWHFNPPYCSHRGGVWERLIRSVRRIITALCEQQTPDDETLSTFLVEAERILNNRPLVPVTSDDRQGLALTPNDLLLLRFNTGLDMPKTISGCYTSGWKHANYLTGVFWKRWTREYLPTLQARQKWLHRERSLKVGDVVLMADEKLQRDGWPLGVVIESHTDPDGLVRTVKLKTSAGEHVRDIRRVCLLEGDDHHAIT